MCGIVCAFDIKQRFSGICVRQVLKMAKKFVTADRTGRVYFCDEKAILAHERLSIVDPESGKQPLFSKDGKLVLAVNGEIYNHQEIRKHLQGKYEFLTNRIVKLFLHFIVIKELDFLEDLNGIFAFALVRHRKRYVT